MTHYDILGVTRLSSTKEIKKAYRRIALISHPDKVSPEQRDDATRMFQEIQVAYDVLQDPIRRQEYDDQVFGPQYSVGASDKSPTSPTSSFDEQYYSREYGYGSESPRTPETPRSYGRESGYWRQESPNTFDAKREFKEYVKKSKVMSFREASLLFHPEDRRHLWLCSEEDDPEFLAGTQLIKPLYVNLQEIFSQETIELTIFRYKYLVNDIKCVEILRKKIKLKPFLTDLLSTIDLDAHGNQYPLHTPLQGYYAQCLTIIPTDESELYGETYEGQFFRHQGSAYDVALTVTVMKDDLRISKKLFNFELDVPSLGGMSVTARFKGRLKRGGHATVVKGQGMWKTFVGGERGDLFVSLMVK